MQSEGSSQMITFLIHHRTEFENSSWTRTEIEFAQSLIEDIATRESCTQKIIVYINFFHDETKRAN